ncbi:MAG: RNA polymerase sigma factor [Frankiaceae bacterium]|nr:RNA polymerase sigma factor [Frankiaceae bacterium]MBV9368436.1 RNA polymerase sigma factor [Frankiales bacterium]
MTADAGDAQAVGDFREWVQPHLLAMARLATRLTSATDSDDVVQEALVRAWRRRESYDASRGSAQSWLLAIVADRCRRHRTRDRHPAAAELLDVAAAPSKDVDRSLDIERALGRLSRRQRVAVELHYYVGLSVAEAAAVMQCSEGTVKSTLSDARKRLLPALQEVF